MLNIFGKQNQFGIYPKSFVKDVALNQVMGSIRPQSTFT